MENNFKILGTIPNNYARLASLYVKQDLTSNSVGVGHRAVPSDLYFKLIKNHYACIKRIRFMYWHFMW